MITDLKIKNELVFMLKSIKQKKYFTVDYQTITTSKLHKIS